MGDHQKKAALFEQFARVGKAMGNGKRLELLDLLAQGERSVENLAAAAGLGLSTASAHLQALKHAGLVSTRKEGTRIHYDLAGEDVARLYNMVRTVARARVAEVEYRSSDYLDSGRTNEDDNDVAPQEMTREELMARVSAGTITVLDVRPPEEYTAAHIPGALSIPLELLADRLSEVPPGREIVAYCRGAYCVLAYEAVDLLRASGRQARRLSEGMLEWRVAELPTMTGGAA